MNKFRGRDGFPIINGGDIIYLVCCHLMKYLSGVLMHTTGNVARFQPESWSPALGQEPSGHLDKLFAPGDMDIDLGKVAGTPIDSKLRKQRAMAPMSQWQ